MIGTDKQIAFAEKCIAAAVAQWERVATSGIVVDRDGSQRAALEVLRLVDAGKMEEAGAIMESGRAAGWPEFCVVERTGGFAVDAGRVIDTLKKYL